MIDLELPMLLFVKYSIENPVLIPTIIASLVGLFYYFGWIVNANNWQYQNSSKQSHIYRGFWFVTNFIFIPAVVIIGLVYLFDKNGAITNILAKIPLWIYFALIVVVLIVLEKLDNWIHNKLANFEDLALASLGVRISRIGDLKWLFFISNYIVFSLTGNLVLILILLWLDFLILSKWARVSTLLNQGAKGIIKIKGKKQKKVRLIEFVENGLFLKIHDETTKKVFAIPTSEIENMELIDEQPNLKTFLERKIQDISNNLAFHQMKTDKEKNEEESK